MRNLYKELFKIDNKFTKAYHKKDIEKMNEYFNELAAFMENTLDEEFVAYEMMQNSAKEIISNTTDWMKELSRK